MTCSFANVVQAAAVQFEGINDTDPLSGFYIDGSIINENVLELDVFGSLDGSVLPFSLQASSASPIQSMFDTVSFTVVAPDGYYISEIYYHESLQTIVTPNSGSAWSIAQGSISVNGQARTLGSVFFASDTDTTFELDAPYDLSGQQVTTAAVAITNSIIAGATGDGEAFIAKGYNSSGQILPRFEVVLESVPVPAAAWLFGSALIGFAAYSRGRRPRIQ
jgi:hypothetical protein